MKPTSPFRLFRLRNLSFLTPLLLFGLITSGCGIAEAVLPQKGGPVKALELDPTEEHSLLGGLGTRWVLFKLDVGTGARRIIRTTVEGVATVGQTVGQSVGQTVGQPVGPRRADAGPGEEIMDFFQEARDAGRVSYARTVPPFQVSIVPRP